MNYLRTLIARMQRWLNSGPKQIEQMREYETCRKCGGNYEYWKDLDLVTCGTCYGAGIADVRTNVVIR